MRGELKCSIRADVVRSTQLSSNVVSRYDEMRAIDDGRWIINGRRGEIGEEGSECCLISWFWNGDMGSLSVDIDGDRQRSTLLCRHNDGE